MKNIYKNLSVLFLGVILSTHSYAQLATEGSVSTILSGSNFFASGVLNDISGASGQHSGKLLGFPRTDLTSFEFNSAIFIAEDLPPIFFDGSIVYNIGAGKTKTGNGVVVEVKPGFYYFSNITGIDDLDIASGKWMPIGGSAVDIVTNTAVETNLTIDGKKVMAFMDTFVADGLETTFTLTNAPADTAIGSIYKVTIYNKTKSVYTNTVYSYDPTTRKIVTGAPSIAAVYPADTYSYILEYIIP